MARTGIPETVRTSAAARPDAVAPISGTRAVRANRLVATATPSFQIESSPAAATGSSASISETRRDGNACEESPFATSTTKWDRWASNRLSICARWVSATTTAAVALATPRTIPATIAEVRSGRAVSER